MKKMFSFLGTTEYVECHYQYGKTATASRFVQTAVYELFCHDFSEEDEVVIFLTPQAKEKNWYDSMSRDNKPLEGLEQAFKRIAPQAKVKLVEISEKQDELHLWELFDTVVNEIDDQDEIVFDVTHGFRSLPIMAMSILNYTRFLKKVTFRCIVYGAFEELGPPNKVKEMDVSERIAPIIDLTPMAKLMDWANGIDHFLRSGDASVIKELTQQQTEEIFRTKGEKFQQIEASRHQHLANCLDAFTQSLQTVRGPFLPESLTKVKDALERAKKTEKVHFRPLVRLFDEVQLRIDKFSGDPVMLGYEAAEWCLDHGLIQQGFTFLEEGIITAVCLVTGLDELDKNDRQLVSSVLVVVDKNTPEEEWRNKDRGRFKQLVKAISPYLQYIKGYSNLVSFRNNINHAGYNRDEYGYRLFYPKLKELHQSMKPLFLEFQRLRNEGRSLLKEVNRNF
jgi:CRISPR-associated Csx2 family protein